MDFDALKKLSEKVIRLKDSLQTEEATKNALVLPFISLLGYDIFDPNEVIPEYTADIGTKKGEKVDYAIFKDSVPVMFFECKKSGSDLEVEHASQLYRYFATSSKIRLAVLTNGSLYHFYSDLDEANMMDKKPFLEINLLDLQDNVLPEIRKLTKNNFNLDQIISSASDLKYLKQIKRILTDQLTNPTDDFIKYFASQIYSGVKTQKVMQQFQEIVKRALTQFINDEITVRLKAVMEKDSVPAETNSLISPITEDLSESKIKTTAEELEAFIIIKAILRKTADIKTITHKDTVNYFGIQINDNSRKTVCKFYFNGKQKYISVYDNKDKKEEKIPIKEIDDIYQFADRIIESYNLNK